MGKLLRDNMFVKKYEYKPGLSAKFCEKVTCLNETSGKLWMGREDGVLECYDGSVDFNTRVFESEFDYLENEDIKEKIIAIDSMSDGGVNDILFVGNEKSVKVLRSRNDAPTLDICNGSLSSRYRVVEIKKCQNIHSYIANSISINKSREYLITSDYIKINMWRPQRMDDFYNILDIKPQLVGGAVFVINSCKFSPFSDSVLAYSSSNGEISINDISITPKSQKVCSMKNVDVGSIKSISDFSFIDSNLIISRSLNNICLFDMRNPKSSIFCKELITDFSEQNMLNSSDAIYEKFKIASSGMYAYTGSYFGSVYSINILGGTQEEIVVGEQRQFGIENRVKLVTGSSGEFSCVLNGNVMKYVRHE